MKEVDTCRRRRTRNYFHNRSPHVVPFTLALNVAAHKAPYVQSDLLHLQIHFLGILPVPEDQFDSQILDRPGSRRLAHLRNIAVVGERFIHPQFFQSAYSLP